MSTKYDELEKIKKMRDEGTLSEEEYEKEKERILNPPQSDYVIGEEKKMHWGMDEKTFCLVMHLSQFAGYTVPLAGLIMPIVMWNCEKKNSANIDAHGAHIINWIITSIIYGIIFVILAFFAIGVPLLIILAICCIVYPIVGAIKAANEELWRYPLTINFIKPQYETEEDF